MVEVIADNLIPNDEHDQEKTGQTLQTWQNPRTERRQDS